MKTRKNKHGLRYHASVFLLLTILIGISSTQNQVFAKVEVSKQSENSSYVNVTGNNTSQILSRAGQNISTDGFPMENSLIPENNMKSNSSIVNDLLRQSTSNLTANSISSSASAPSGSRAHGDFNGDGFDDLAIGVPGEDVGLIINAGAVEVIYGSPTGLSATSIIADQFWTQDSPSVKDTAEELDFFGRAL